MKIIYKVAGHCFAVKVDDSSTLASELTQYDPFKVDTSKDNNLVFELEVVKAEDLGTNEPFTKEIFQDDDGSQIEAGQMGGLPAFKFMLHGHLSARMVTSADYTHAKVVLDYDPLFGINNAMMVMYALSTSCKQTALFHSSVISYQGKGYMFLGKSGTGKSTHSRLWLEHIEGTELMNDDNPVVRIIDGTPWVFGSPWSGKTPCYKNVKAPIGAIVSLSQAPYNKASRLKGLKAYAELIPSISGKRWDRKLADGLHATEEELVRKAPMFHLECLPDKAAAITCKEAVTSAL